MKRYGEVPGQTPIKPLTYSVNKSYYSTCTILPAVLVNSSGSLDRGTYFITSATALPRLSARYTSSESCELWRLWYRDSASSAYRYRDHWVGCMKQGCYSPRSISVSAVDTRGKCGINYLIISTSRTKQWHCQRACKYLTPEFKRLRSSRCSGDLCLKIKSFPPFY